MELFQNISKHQCKVQTLVEYMFIYVEQGMHVKLALILKSCSSRRMFHLKGVPLKGCFEYSKVEHLDR